MFRGKINEKVIKENYDDVLRLAASIRKGTVPASLILSKIGSYSKQNGLSTQLLTGQLQQEFSMKKP